MLVVFSVLMMCAAVASSALAVTATAPAGTPIPAGTEIVGTGTTNSTFTASTLIGNVTITCDQSKVVGDVEANPSTGGKAWGTITTISWSGCSNAFGSCTAPTPVNAPWSPTTNGGGLVATSTTLVDLGTGTNGAIDISACAGISPCTVGGLNSSTITDTTTGGAALSLTSWLSGSYSSDELTIVSTAIRAVNCAGITNMSWNAKYTLELTNGTPVTLS